MKFKCFVLTLVIAASVILPGCTKHYCPDESELLALDIYHYPKTLENCIQNYASDLIEGKCLSCSDLGDFMYYRFELVNSYFAFVTHETNNDNIYHVIVSKKVKKNNEQDIYPVSFNVGETYLILLVKAERVYQPFDACCLVSEYLYFDNENIKNSKMNGKPLTECSELDTIESKDALVSYMVDKLKERFREYGTEYCYTTSDDLAYIADFCPYILTVKVGKRIGDVTQEFYLGNAPFSDYESVGEYSCEIVSALKTEKQLSSQIYVAFKDSEVKAGETYIVCLKNNTFHDDGSKRYKIYLFGSKLNMFDVSMEDTLTELINSV